jgi:hypothetical protein
MGVLQDAVDKAVADIPRLGIEKIIADKLKAAGADDPALAKRIAAAVIEGTGDRIEFECDQQLDLVIDDEDVKRITRAAELFTEGLPDFIRTMTEDLAGKLADDFMEQWKSFSASDERATTLAKIKADWGEPLDRLRMLVALCEQEGDTFNIKHLSSKSGRGELCAEALARLHIRACRIANEIILLIENGFAEGAQARWRTLHEVAVTATLIAEGGDALAERYFDHEAVERKRALDDHRRAAAIAGEPGVSRHHSAGIEEDYGAAVNKYGKSFNSMYGWASGQLGIPKEPKFHDLQEAAGSLTLKLRYRLASFDTHASSGALEQPVHRWDPTTHIPGAFAAGFEEPASDTAQAIVQITGLLRAEPWNVDNVAFGLAMIRLRNETARAWHDAARRVARREQRALDRATRRPGPQRRFGYVKTKPGPRRI